MPYTVALVLNKLTDEEKLKEMIVQYIENKPPVQLVKDTVHYILGENDRPNPLLPITKGIKKFYTLPDDRQLQIQEKIKEIQALLAA